MKEVIETSGEEKKEETAAEEAKPDETAEAPAAEAPTAEAPAEKAPEKAPEPPSAAAPSKDNGAPEKAPEKAPREPSQAVLDATVAMGQAAAEGAGEAQAVADRMEREALLETISFQVPEGWLTPDVSERLGTIPTPALATILTWLSLTWWQGYEHGRIETVNALKRAHEKGLGSPEDKAALGKVEEEIKREGRAVAEAIEAGQPDSPTESRHRREGASS